MIEDIKGIHRHLEKLKEKSKNLGDILKDITDQEQKKYLQAEIKEINRDVHFLEGNIALLKKCHRNKKRRKL